MLLSCVDISAQAQARNSAKKPQGVFRRALRRASSSVANPSVKASTYTSLNVGALAAPSGAAAAKGSSTSASATLDLARCGSAESQPGQPHAPHTFLFPPTALACGSVLW